MRLWLVGAMIRAFGCGNKPTIRHEALSPYQTFSTIPIMLIPPLSQIFLEEEREKELEELYESTLTTSLGRDEAIGEDGPEVASAGKQTIETLMAGEKIMEALDLGAKDLALMEEYRAAKTSHPNLAPPPRNPLYIALGGTSAESHLLNTLQKIKASHLQDALLVLPFEKVASFLVFLGIFASRVSFFPFFF